MKKIFTLLFATMMAMNMNAQMHGAMKFAGASHVNVATMDIDNASDTIQFAMQGITSGNITFPQMKGMSTIPSFTVQDVAFSLGANHVVTMAEQDFSTTTTDASGAEKKISGKLSGTYSMADNKMSLKAVFKYGAMPLDLTYTVDAFYIKAVTSAITVSVGGMYNYDNESVTYNVRKYKDGDVEKVDVEIPTYQLAATVMGDLTLGTYTVKGLTYDEEKGGYYRDYKDDGLKFHFTAESNGNKTMDNDYDFNPAKANNILVKYTGTNVTDIVNNFQMGAMPFGITSAFKASATGISHVNGAAANVKNDGKMYNLQGQQVGESYKGVVIVNGKKFLKN